MCCASPTVMHISALQCKSGPSRLRTDDFRWCSFSHKITRNEMSTVTLPKSPPRPQATDDSQGQKFEYPGIPTTCDGAEAVVHVEINVAQAAGAYPITSSTTMGGGFNAAAMNGYRN